MKHASEAKLSPSFGNEFEYISASIYLLALFLILMHVFEDLLCDEITQTIRWFPTYELWST